MLRQPLRSTLFPYTTLFRSFDERGPFRPALPGVFDELAESRLRRWRDVKRRRRIDGGVGRANQAAKLRFRDAASGPGLDAEHPLPRFLGFDGEHVARRHQARIELVARISQMRTDTSQGLSD